MSAWLIHCWLLPFMAKPKEEEKDRPEGGYRHAESTAGKFCMLLTSTEQMKEKVSLLKEGQLTLLLFGTCLHGPWREAGEIRILLVC